MSRLEFGATYVPRGPIWNKPRQDDHHSHTTKQPVTMANQDIRRYVNKMRRTGSEEGWLAYPEIPSAEEIMCVKREIDLKDNCINLEPNLVDGPWPSVEDYLRTHYELLREDTVGLLRDSVAYLRDKPYMTDTKTTCVYDQVYITGMTFARQGIAFRISFSTIRACKNIVWEYSARLISGSMVALSPANDCFKSQCVIATVAARPLDQVKQHPPSIDLYIANPDQADFDPQKEWIMVQPRTGYLESTRHTMKTLQLMSGERFPFSEYVCELKKEIDVPDYVKAEPEMKITSDLIVDVLSDWPQKPENDLDASQWEALRHILTKRLAVIQGPPGTGKTHVSVSALKILLANRKPKDPPIIVTAHTNHALDQLLNHISEVVPDYVRLGGRSTDENVKKRTLFEVHKSTSIPPLTGGALIPANRRLDAIGENITNLLQAFITEKVRTIPAAFFRDQKIITNKQYESLCDGAHGWTSPDTEGEVDPIVPWAGDMLVENVVRYHDTNHGYEEDEMDLEYEQLREMEQEKGVVEDDYEVLRGRFVSLRETVRGKSNIDDEFVEYLSVENLWDIPLQHRGMVYNALCRIAKERLLSRFRQYLKIYSKTVLERSIGKWEVDYALLKDTKVIGMTTTGLSKNRALVSALKPKIVMIEEAAEIIEAPVAAACVESLEHLILVGDHKQLQGNCSITDLDGEPFFLNMSMFERLVENGVDFRSLLHQRRMAPEIRRLLTPIYNSLRDHPTVNDLAKVPGMGDVRSFLFCHQWPESSDSLSSRYNIQEAEMVVAFFLHLHFSGVDPETITVLTFYNGQRKKILKLLKENQHLQDRRLKVKTVDSYQGEEADIVLLSLVRSNEEGKIGFLSIENRVCVALSRARRGFYLFGDAQRLAMADPLWWEVVKIMGEGHEETRRMGYHLPLTCDRHGNKEFVASAEEIKALNGGCRLPCGRHLDCGHPCPMKCHGFGHSLIRCHWRCDKLLLCGHKCLNTCSAMTCSCVCGYKTKMTTVSSPTKASASSSSSSSPSKANAHEPNQPHQYQHQVFPHSNKERIRAFQHFAKGGSREHDRILNDRFSANVTENQLLARLAAQESTNLSADPQQPTVTAVQDIDKRVLFWEPNEEAGATRTRWVQAYSPAVPPVEQQLQQQSMNEVEEDLIEFD